MIVLYLFSDPLYWVPAWALQTVIYFLLLRKLQLKKWTALIPFLAERQFSTLLFRRLRSFYRPFVVSAILAAAALYLGTSSGMGETFMLIACLIYGIFLLRLYWRMGKAMGKGWLFRMFTILIPPLFLLILGLGKSVYRPLPMKPLKEHSRAGTNLRRAGLVLISAVEICVIVFGVGALAVWEYPPAPLVNYLLNSTYKETKDITGTGDVVSREDAMGKAAGKIAEMIPSREHFFPDHSQDQNVVVMTYVVGSNLENKTGLASCNILQMIDASKQGDGLTFVMEAGGSGRWFTKGIADNSYGRYEVKDGSVNKVEDLPSDTCMAEPKTLEEFISWTKEKYPADRYMLVLWDHGGGVPYGYGRDDLNVRDSGKNEGSTMTTSEVVSAIRKAGQKFDMIGFDACLMQDIEIAAALEPYADYYLGSEETEGGTGWFYTSAFGKLAQDPGMSSEEFGREMIACYDPYNRITTGDGEPVTESTLSFVDLTLAEPACDKLKDLLATMETEIRNDPGSFADIADAAANSYTFTDDLQIDLIDFLKILDKIDYNEEICTHKEKAELWRALQACVLWRNADSAKGVNGIAMAFPYKSIGHYSQTARQLKKLSMTAEKNTFDVVFSIMAAQQKKDMEKNQEKFEDDPSMNALMEMLEYEDYTKEPWYIKGFEDYDQAKAYVDIPLLETADGYVIELPEKAWKIIADCQTILYQKTEGKGGRELWKYLGTDHIGGDDPDGHPMVSMDGTWVHIQGETVCYEAQQVRETDDGDIYTGIVRARLNGTKDICLNIEWDPVAEGQEAPARGHITGYDTDSLLDSFLDTKTTTTLEAGDTIQFLYDYYDAEGNLVKTAPGGQKIHVTKQSRLDVTDEALDSGDIRFGGVLTDVYQRVMTTEQIEVQLDE